MMLSPAGREQLREPRSRDLLVAELDSLLDSVNASLENHEKLKYAVIVHDLWSVENGFLTATMKIRREVIEDRYLKKAQEWSAMGRTVIVDADGSKDGASLVDDTN
ncbi:hypothetical protein D9M70_326520 [compost metagenome]